MKTILPALGWLCACTVHAQLSTLPPAVAPTVDFYGNPTQWGAQLHALTPSGAANSPIETLAAGDGVLMGGGAPGVSPELVAIRVIYLGHTAGVNLNLGYTFHSGGPGAPVVTSRTLIAATDAGPAAFTYWDIPMTALAFAGFDLWLNVAPTAGGAGGLFHVFHPEWNQGAGGTAHWSESFGLDTTMFDAASGAPQTQLWETRVLAFEDGQQGGGDSDRSDLILAIQTIPAVGRPTTILPGVPEPAAFTWAGAVTAALVVVGFRRAGRQRGRS